MNDLHISRPLVLASLLLFVLAWAITEMDLFSAYLFHTNGNTISQKETIGRTCII